MYTELVVEMFRKQFDRLSHVSVTVTKALAVCRFFSGVKKPVVHFRIATTRSNGVQVDRRMVIFASRDIVNIAPISRVEQQRKDCDVPVIFSKLRVTAL